MKKKTLSLTVPALLAASLIILLSLAAVGGVRWAANGVGIRTVSSNNANEPQITSDGAGGAIITWYDARAAVGHAGVYAQRVDAAGNRLWTADGVGVCTESSSIYAAFPQIVTDGAGGAIITWQDYRAGHNDIYAQRVNASGSVVWAAGGVGIRTAAAADAGRPQIVSDGSGGAIITWEDQRAGGGYIDIYAQRVDAAGNPLWTPDGEGIRYSSLSAATHPQITSDGFAGAIITWQDSRDGLYDIYAQRVDYLGYRLWTADGVGIRTSFGFNATNPRITSDGSAGAIITWEDGRDGHGDIYAQRVDTAGNRLWTADGVGVRTTSGHNAEYPRITSDGSDEAVIAWIDNRSGTKWDIYAQKINASGNRLWTADGVGVRTSPAGDTNSPCITSDGSGGAVIAWEDNRAGHYDIYAQRMDAAGEPSWTAEGVVVRTAASDAGSSQMVMDGSGGAIVTWQDNRAGHYGIYAQRVSRSAPTVTGINPSRGANDEVVNITNLAGSGFFDVGGAPGIRLRRSGQPDIIAAYTNVPSANRITCQFDLTGAELGAWDVVVTNPDGQSAMLAAGFRVTLPSWYLAEGCTGGDFETWVLVQNPNATAVTVDLSFLTSTGPQSGPRDVTIPANSRTSFNVAESVVDYNVSTVVESTGGRVICERAMYGGNRTWGTDSIGVTAPAPVWYLAEGATAGDFETWVLVQNPNSSDVIVDLNYMTTDGLKPGPQDVDIPGNSRKSFNVGESVTDFNVSTKVEATGGDVICERAVYGNGHTWAHDSVGVTTPAPVWYMAEGCTGGDFETWVLVQNPNATAVTVDLNFMTSGGLRPGPQDVTIPANSRQSFNVGESVTDFNVSTKVEATGGNVICERAMYGGNRTWGTDSIGVTTPAPVWYMAEGCTGGDFETWVLVQNPNATDVVVDLNYMTPGGLRPGPQDVTIPANSRQTFNVGDTLVDFSVSTVVTSSGGNVICERAMYGGNRTWAHDSIGYAP